MSGATRCLHYAMAIQRHYRPMEWPAALEQDVPKRCRAECKRYLKSIDDRMRARRRALRRR
jgi:hypothetical protein